MQKGISVNILIAIIALIGVIAFNAYNIIIGTPKPSELSKSVTKLPDVSFGFLNDTGLTDISTRTRNKEVPILIKPGDLPNN